MPLPARFAALLAAVLSLSAVASAEETPPQASFGHLPYDDAPTATLVKACDAGGAEKNRLRQETKTALDAMKAAALKDDVVLKAISCFRSIARQEAVFCGRVCDPDATICPAGCNGKVRIEAERARSSAPPGFSEHHTGYAVDFTDGSGKSGCADLEACFAETPAGKWLLAHAVDHGFELSFPKGNTQGVTYEPWHWRYVATPEAKATFAWARKLFPANPAVPE